MEKNATAIVQSIGGWETVSCREKEFFAEVLEGGNICVGDSVEVRMPQANRPYSTAVITLSDKAFAGEREDLSGPAVEKMLRRK